MPWRRSSIPFPEPNYAVVWSGMWNLIGVLTSSGAVAFGIVALLPAELVINVGSGAGFAMVFSLLAVRDHLERRYVVPRPACFQLAHSDRIHCRRRIDEFAANEG